MRIFLKKMVLFLLISRITSSFTLKHCKYNYQKKTINTMMTNFGIKPAKPVLGKLETLIVSSYNRYIIPISIKKKFKQNKNEIIVVNSTDEQDNAFARVIVRMYKYGI